MTDVMLDLETLGTRPNAVILSIGAIKFDRHRCDIKRDKNYKSLPSDRIFYERIHIKSCLDVGLVIDEATDEWWKKQPVDVQYEALHNKDRSDIKTVLERFNKWFDGSIYIWGNGSSFDITIIEEAFRRCDIKQLWLPWDVRDLRTLYDMGDVSQKDVPNKNKHHPVHDCYNQIIGFQMAVDAINR